MKLLFDQNISFRVTKMLQDHIPNCKHVSDCGLMDQEDLLIWEFAKKNKFTIVTFDSDFYDVSLIKGHPPKIVWIRVGNQSNQAIVQLLIKNGVEIMNFVLKEEFREKSCMELGY